MIQERDVTTAVEKHPTWLLERMPRLQALRAQRVVIKYGGNAMTDEGLKRQFAQDVALLQQFGVEVYVVHGGGPQINQMLERLGHVGAFIQGMRVTDAETMRVAEMVLGGLVNKEVVSLINQQGARAVGLTGKDGGCIRARPLSLQDQDGQTIDLGQVGEVESIDPTLFNVLLAQNFIPVIAPIGVGAAGEAFNINADLVAGSLAERIAADHLVLLTNTPGVLDKTGALLPCLSAADSAELIANGAIYGGMLPKINSALEAATRGVGAVYILDGRLPHALLLSLLTDEAVGTMIHA